MLARAYQQGNRIHGGHYTINQQLDITNVWGVPSYMGAGKHGVAIPHQMMDILDDIAFTYIEHTPDTPSVALMFVAKVRAYGFLLTIL